MMDTDNFLGSDDAQYDDEELDEDDDYNALNDETFGSAAFDEDWEQNHEQLAYLRESERLQRTTKKDDNYELLSSSANILREFDNSDQGDGIGNCLRNISLDGLVQKRRLYERTGESSDPIVFHNDEISGSPSTTNIWSPTQSFETFNKTALSEPTELNRKLFVTEPLRHKVDNAQNVYNFNNEALKPSSLLSYFKTVSEVEEELKRQHTNQHQMVNHIQDLSRKLPQSKIENDRVRMSNYVHPGAQASNSNLSATFPGVRIPNHFLSRPHQLIPNSTPGGIHRPLVNAPPGHIINGAHGIRMMPGGVIPQGFLPMRHMMNERQMLMAHQLNQRMPLNRLRNNNQIRSTMHRNLFDSNYHGGHHHTNNGRDVNMHEERRVRRDSDVEWEEWQRKREMDEYYGLMTPKEKSWLRNIQSLQLQTENPYENDYYFVMFKLRQQRKREEEVIEVNGRQLLLGDRGKDDKQYKPPKLENSLGKLQCVSVNAPRRIIDLQVVHLDSSHPTTSLQRDMRKHRQLLMHIEKLYGISIELDDLERKIRALSDCPTRDLFRSKCSQLVKKLWSSITIPHESFVQVLCVNKGKTLMARFMNWLQYEEVEHVLATTIQNWALLTKKDVQDKRLMLFWPYADRFFSFCPATAVATFGIMVTAQLQPQKNKSIPMLSNRFGLSVVLRLLVRGEQLWSELEADETWHQFLSATVVALSSLSVEELSGVEPLPSVSLAASSCQTYVHLMKCPGALPAQMEKALDFLKKVESVLLKNMNCSPNAAK